MSLALVPQPDGRQRLLELEADIEDAARAFFAVVGTALREIRDSRLYRGTHDTFDAYTRERWSMSRIHAHRLIDAAAVAAVLPAGNTLGSERHARELVPLLRDEGENAVLDVWRQLRGQYGDSITADRVRRIVANRMNRYAHEDEAARLMAQSRDAAEVIRGRLQLGDGIELVHGDFRAALAAIPDHSIDLLFTDPPFYRDAMPLWTQLGEAAARILRPGCLAVVYCGNVHVPEGINRLAEHLDWVTAGATLMPGQRARLHNIRMNIVAKPLLFFSAGTYAPKRYADNAFTHTSGNKTAHPWAQDVGCAAYYIERLTEPGDHVVDPFVGSGTTGIAAAQHGRRFTGIDIDEKSIRTAADRITDTLAAPSTKTDAQTLDTASTSE